MRRARTFEDNKLALIMFIDGRGRGAYILIRTFKDDKAWFSLRGVHALCIKRHGSSLQLRQWCTEQQNSANWATLDFKTWEGWFSFAFTE